MPGRPIVALLLALASGSAVAADAPARYTLRYDADTETMAVRICLARA
jgi:hypothetical protein